MSILPIPEPGENDDDRKFVYVFAHKTRVVFLNDKRKWKIFRMMYRQNLPQILFLIITPEKTRVEVGSTITSKIVVVPLVELKKLGPNNHGVSYRDPYGDLRTVIFDLKESKRPA